MRRRGQAWVKAFLPPLTPPSPSPSPSASLLGGGELVLLQSRFLSSCSSSNPSIEAADVLRHRSNDTNSDGNNDREIALVYGGEEQEFSLAQTVSSSLRSSVARLSLQHNHSNEQNRSNSALPDSFSHIIWNDLLLGVKGKHLRDALVRKKEKKKKRLSSSSSSSFVKELSYEKDTQTYLLDRFAGDFAVVRRIVSEISNRFPEYRPTRFLEFCPQHTATGSLAALHVFGRSASSTEESRSRYLSGVDVSAVCDNRFMRRAAAKLLRAALNDEQATSEASKESSVESSPSLGEVLTQSGYQAFAELYMQHMTWYKHIPNSRKRKDRFDFVVSAFSLSREAFPTSVRRVKNKHEQLKHLSGGRRVVHDKEDDDANINEREEWIQRRIMDENEYAKTRELRKTAAELWDHVVDGGMLVIIEDGSNEGCRIVQDVRNYLIEREKRVSSRRGDAGAIEGDENSSSFHIAGPCPHEQKCPLQESNAATAKRCYFRQRIEVPKYKGAKMKVNGKGFDDKYYSYVVLQKSPRPGMFEATLDDNSTDRNALYGIDMDHLFTPEEQLSKYDVASDDEDNIEDDMNYELEDNEEDDYRVDAEDVQEDKSYHSTEMIPDEIEKEFSPSIRSSANSGWSRVITSPSKRKKGLVGLQVVRISPFKHHVVASIVPGKDRGQSHTCSCIAD